jgi:hypothetical protein
MTFPTESPRLEAVSIRDQGWTTTGLRRASPRVGRVGSLTSTKTWPRHAVQLPGITKNDTLRALQCYSKADL